MSGLAASESGTRHRPAGELTAVWVPDPAHEAMRKLTRSRTATVETIRGHEISFPIQMNWVGKPRETLADSES
jgi:hypothetical protein